MASIKNAFTYMFEDNKFFVKASIFLIPVFLLMYGSFFGYIYNKGIQLTILNYVLLSTLLLITQAVCDGYKISNIKALQMLPELKVLPIINLKLHLITGLKFLGAFLLLTTPWLLLIATFGFLYGFSMVLGIPEILVKIFGVFVIFTIASYIIYMTCFLPASISVFCKTNNIFSFYNFEEIFGTFLNNKKKYIIATALYAIAGSITGLMYKLAWTLSGKGNIYLLFMIILPAIVCVYLFFVQNKLVADLES